MRAIAGFRDDQCRCSTPAALVQPSAANDDYDLQMRSTILGSDLTRERAAQFQSASPFPHIVIDDLFSRHLLDSVLAEFPGDQHGFRKIEGRNELTHRQRDPSDLGPAGRSYVNIVHSHRFVEYLSAISGIPNLVIDHGLRSGGLHETVDGGHFAIHSDFNYHPDTLLRNALVLLTYLNDDWDGGYGGALELWDAQTRQCRATIAPTMGRTVLMRNSDISFHGHPAPLSAPLGRTRRSIATYYYVNESAEQLRPHWHSSAFLADFREAEDGSLRWHRPQPTPTMTRRAKTVLRDIVPPVLWRTAKRGATKLAWARRA